MRLVSTVTLIPSYSFNVVASGIFVSAAVVAPTGSEFPFCLCGQAEVFPRQCIQLTDKCLAVVPTNGFHRQAVALPVRWVTPHHGIPKCLSDLVLTNVEATQSHAVDRFFVIIGITPLLARGTHGEGASGNIDHIGRQIIQDQLGICCRRSRTTRIRTLSRTWFGRFVRFLFGEYRLRRLLRLWLCLRLCGVSRYRYLSQQAQGHKGKQQRKKKLMLHNCSFS